MERAVSVSTNVVFGISACLILGCGTTDIYDAMRTSELEAATIQGASRATVLFSPRAVVIRAVDGEPIPITASSVRVSPGGHVLRVTCYESLFARNTHELNIMVQAGETYTLSSRIDPTKIKDGTAKCNAVLLKDDLE